MVVIKEEKRTQIIIENYKIYEKEILKIVSSYLTKIIKNEKKMIIVIYGETDLAEKINEILEEDILVRESKDFHLNEIKTHPPKKSIIMSLEKPKTKYLNGITLPKGYPYYGMSPASALEMDGLKALKSLLLMKNELDTNKYKYTIRAIEVTTEKWAEKNLKNPDPANKEIEYVKCFIKDTKEIVPEMIQNILNKTSYSSIDDFLEYADEKVIRSAYATLNKKIIEKIN